MKVLIADDTPIMRQDMRNIMKELEHEVVYEAINGIEAVKGYKEYKPDFVTMDINMPRMGGILALEHILEMHDGAKILMVTDNGMENSVVRAIRAGALGYVLKPASVDAIKSAIDRVFRGSDGYDDGDDDDGDDLFTYV